MSTKSYNDAPSSEATASSGAAVTTKKTWCGKIRSLFSDKLAIDFHQRQEPDTGAADVNTQLAHERTDMAVNRTYWAADRTLQAWVRTTLSMISFGFTLGKIGQAMEDIEVKSVFAHSPRTVSISSIAYGLVLLGTLALIAAIVQHWLRVRELRAMGLRPQVSISFYVAILLSLVGGFAFTALVLDL
jgi:putative membrane protein